MTSTEFGHFLICLGLIKKRNLPKGSGSQEVACDWPPRHSHEYNQWLQTWQSGTLLLLRAGVLPALMAQHFSTYAAKIHRNTLLCWEIPQLCGKPKHHVPITSWSSPMWNFPSVKSCVHTYWAQSDSCTERRCSFLSNPVTLYKLFFSLVSQAIYCWILLQWTAASSEKNNNRGIT